MISSRRTARRDPGQARVTDREFDGLLAIGEAGSLTTPQYQRVLGVSNPIARRSARKLRNLGLVQSHLVAFHEANRLTLTKRGAAELAQKFDHPEEAFRLLRKLPAELEHHERGVDMFIGLTLACERSNSFMFERYLFEPEIRALTGSAPGALVPDAIVVLFGTGGSFAIAIEIDLGTERPNFVARTKGEGYAQLAESEGSLVGCPKWRVVFVAPTDRRRNRLAIALWDVGIPENLFFFSSFSAALDDRQILKAEPWVTPRVVGEGATLVAASPFEFASSRGSSGAPVRGGGR